MGKQYKLFIGGLIIMEIKFCECGCGQQTTPCKQNNIKRGMIKGKPNRFLPGHAVRSPILRSIVDAIHSQTGELNPRWKGNNIKPQSSRRRAQKIYSIHEHLCDRCGDKKRLVRHHKDRNPMNNSSTNVEFLCYSCHGKEHLND